MVKDGSGKHSASARGREREMRYNRVSSEIQNIDETDGKENKGGGRGTPEPLGRRENNRKSCDSRTADRVPTTGTTMTPLRQPQPAIYKERLPKRPVKRQQGERKPRGRLVFRPASQARTEAQRKTEAEHRRTREEAEQLRYLLDHTVYDSPSNPDALFSAVAVAIAKRGRRCVIETALLGSNNTRSAIRNFDRRAKKHGDENAEVGRLKEYHTALDSYHRIMRRAKEGR